MLAEENRWGWATVLGGLATVTRPVGIAVVVGLVVFALARGRRQDAARSVFALAPLLAFSAYLWARFGHPFAFLTYHSAGWVPPHGGLIDSIGSQFHTSLTPFDRIDAALVLLFLASGILAWRRLGPGYGAFVLLGVFLPLVHGLVSMERYVVVLFPAFAVWATWGNRVMQMVLLGTSLLMFLIFSMMFAAGYSVF